MQAPVNHFTPFAARALPGALPSPGPFTPRLPRVGPALSDRMLSALLCAAILAIGASVVAGI